MPVLTLVLLLSRLSPHIDLLTDAFVAYLAATLFPDGSAALFADLNRFRHHAATMPPPCPPSAPPRCPSCRCFSCVPSNAPSAKSGTRRSGGRCGSSGPIAACSCCCPWASARLADGALAAGYAAVYGRFAAVLLFLLWINLLWTVLLSGAVLAALLDAARQEAV